MKGLNFLAAFLGGAAIGAAFGILFAPEKGEDTRQKIKDILREKGIKLNRSEMDELVDKKFQGSLPAFIAAFGKRQALSDEQIRQIRRIIEE